jgi:uncharacterized protein
VSFPPDDPVPPSKPADTLVERRASSPVQAEHSSTDASAQGGAGFTSASQLSAGQTVELFHAAPVDPALPDPAWNGWDVLRLIFLTIVALFVGVFVVLLIARIWVYPHRGLAEIARVPLVVIAGQSLAYLLILAYMYILVTRERRRPDFLAAVHWNFPSSPFLSQLWPFWFLLWPFRSLLALFRAKFPRVVSAFSYLLLGLVLSVALQVLAHLLPIPKELPIDSFFRTPAEAWALSILSVTLAPLMEELFFRAFLYPVLARRLGLPVAVFITALAFALLHGAQLMFSWGPVLAIFLVGLVLTMVRAKQNSVAASLLIHMAYNGTITVAMFAATDGFRHLEKLNQ